MAQEQRKRKKHGKVEARKAKPVIRFKLGVLLLLILAAFGGCFALHMVSATAQPDYWEKEIIGSTEATEPSDEAETTEAPTAPSAAVNPVPASERADDIRLSVCAYAGDFTEFTTYYKTASGMVFTDAVFGMSESEMRNMAEEIAESSPLAVYLWYGCPEDREQGTADMAAFLEALCQQTEAPLYLMTALPAAEKAENTQIDAWNAALLALADQLDIHYVDVSTKLKANDGTLAEKYTQEEALYHEVGEQLLTHVDD